MTACQVEDMFTEALRVAAVVARVVDPVVICTGILMNEKDPGSGRKKDTAWETDAPAPCKLVEVDPTKGMF